MNDVKFENDLQCGETNKSVSNEVKTSLLQGNSYPLVIEPNLDNVDVHQWIKDNKDVVDSYLIDYGAILFRGFNLESNERFQAFAERACDGLFSDYADLPEVKGSKCIYGSTPYPNDRTIFFHNESSHLNQWPLKQFFACVQPSVEGGETPIVDCRKVYNDLPSEFRDKYEKVGLNYIRNFIDGLDVNWRDFFKTEDKKEVEAKCQSDGINFKWQANDGLKISKHVTAQKTHPKTGESIFFNQIQLHHPAFLIDSEREALTLLFGSDGMPRNVVFGDGSQISDEEALAVYNVYDKNCVKFLWQKGDLLMLDNMLMAHARLPFKGERKILVAMGEMQVS